MNRNRTTTARRVAACAAQVVICSAWLGSTARAEDLPVISVTADDTVIRESCQLRFPAGPIPDLNGNGVVQIVASGITVDLAGGVLRGSPESAPLDRCRGVGIAISAPGVTLRNGRVHGFRVGVLGQGCSESRLESLNVSDNFAQRLLSTDRAEEPTDWLWPHENDAHEWRTNYGAGICVESAADVTLRDITARRTQNGILLDRVTGSNVVDCDCSFLSGWGLALWRSTSNTILRNAFDFCVRGYSHGIYNRGQDSAGILVFEQSSNNLFAENSATHCGDGYFSFAGREALGEGGRGGPLPQDHLGLGCNDNVLVANDFSDAAAHGIETTFSESNVIVGNTLARNAICGVWGGYSGNLLIAGNTLDRNGDAGSGAERGGVNIEHGRGAMIDGNTFQDCPVGVALWWDEDPSIFATLWAQATGTDAIGTSITGNTFVRCATAIELRSVKETSVGGNSFESCATELQKVDSAVQPPAAPKAGLGVAPPPPSAAAARAAQARRRADEAIARLEPKRTPVNGRASLAGRDRIRMTEWGPWDQVTPTLVWESQGIDEHRFAIVGASMKGAQVSGRFGLRATLDINSDTVLVYRQPPEDSSEPGQEGAVLPYSLSVRWGADRSQTLRRNGVIAPIQWRVSCFALSGTALPDASSFERDAVAATDQHIVAGGLDFSLGNGAPTSIPQLGFATGIPADRFGLRATARVLFPPGCWVLKTVSDDGIRVTADGQTILEDWTHHAATAHEATISTAEAKEISLTIDWFDLDGAATLRVWFEACPPPALSP